MKQRRIRRTLRKRGILLIPTKKGLREIEVRDSHEASIVRRYWNAVARYLRTGDAKALRKFKGVRVIERDGTQVPLLTDLHDLDRLGDAGDLSFETIYAKR